MSSISSNANIIIDGNTINHGVFSDNSTNTIYTHTHSAWVYGSSIITNNSFYNPSASADMLNITDGSCIIKNNKFYRNGTNIHTYITHHYSDGYAYNGIDQITDNVFDASTTDGSTTDLVLGLSPTSLYTRNKNQTFKFYIPLNDNSIGSITSSVALYETKLINFIQEPSEITTVDFGGSFQLTRRGGGDNKNLITGLNSSSANSSFHLIFRRSFDPANYAPSGAQIINVRVGATTNNTIDPTSVTDFTSCYFRVLCIVHEASTSMDPFVNLNANDAIFGFTVDYRKDFANSSDLTTLNSSTVYTTSPVGGISVSDSNYHGFIQPDALTIGNGYTIELVFEVNIHFTTLYFMYFSPIEVTCMW